MCVDEWHHDIVSFFDDMYKGTDFDARVVEDDSGMYVNIIGNHDVNIIVEDGQWYCC